MFSYGTPQCGLCLQPGEKSWSTPQHGACPTHLCVALLTDLVDKLFFFLNNADSSFEGKTDPLPLLINKSSFTLKLMHFLGPAASVKELLQDLSAGEL